MITSDTLLAWETKLAAARSDLTNATTDMEHLEANEAFQAVEREIHDAWIEALREESRR
jgi:hypothetical protein